jgi:catechol 2,3-dioxygenase-like lactoylglutathione lyase family enzyme
MLAGMPERSADAVGLRVELFVKQPLATVAFYERLLGFKLERHGDGYWSLRNGRVTIGVGAAEGLAPDHHFVRPSAGASARGVGVELVLELPSAEAVDTVFERIHLDVEAAGGQVEPVSDRAWGLRDFRVIDPDGYYIRVTHR